VKPFPPIALFLMGLSAALTIYVAVMVVQHV
jgi:hypothetical protein